MTKDEVFKITEEASNLIYSEGYRQLSDALDQAVDHVSHLYDCLARVEALADEWLNDLAVPASRVDELRAALKGE